MVKWPPYIRCTGAAAHYLLSLAEGGGQVSSFVGRPCGRKTATDTVHD